MIVELQSLRGLAALVVVFNHCLSYYVYDAAAKHGFDVLINAHGAVVLFYVLSGFVLSLAFDRQGFSSQGIITFYVRRIWRIYPALWVAAVLATAYMFAFRDHPFPATVSSWFAPDYRNPHPSWPKIAAAYAGLSHTLPLPMWSITIELVASALMPMMLWSSRSPVGYIATGAVLLLLSFAGGMDMHMSVGGYLIDFLLGVGLSRWWVPRLKVSVLGRYAPWIVLAALMGLDLVRQLLASGRQYHDPLAAFCEALFAMVLVGAIAAWPGRLPVMRLQPLIALGDLSYSLYLLHLPILALVAGVGGEMMGLPGLSSSSGAVATVTLIAIVVPLSLVLASLSYRYVEIPGVTLGRYTARALARS